MTDDNVILDYVAPQTTSAQQLRPVTVTEAVWHVFTAILLPIVCFALSVQNYPAVLQPYQSGEIEAYVGLIPRAECAWPFYPLLAFSIYSAVEMVIAPRRACASALSRLGLYTGVLLAIQFSVIQMICFRPEPEGIEILLGVGVPLVVVTALWVLRWLIKRFGEHRVGLVILAAAMIVTGILGLVVIRGGRAALRDAAFWCLWGPLMIAPALTLGSYVALSIRAYQLSRGDLEQPRWRFALPFAWLGAYIVAWRLCVLAVISEYAKLPKENPRCYVATAAAHGHPWVVRSRTITKSDGSTVNVSIQLTRLKCMELALLATAPRLHQLLRRIYDSVGTTVAKRIRHPLTADLAYVSLKPIEWTAMLLMWIWLPEVARRAPRLYDRLCPAHACSAFGSRYRFGFDRSDR